MPVRDFIGQNQFSGTISSLGLGFWQERTQIQMRPCSFKPVRSAPPAILFFWELHGCVRKCSCGLGFLTNAALCSMCIWFRGTLLRNRESIRHLLWIVTSNTQCCKCYFVEYFTACDHHYLGANIVLCIMSCGEHLVIELLDITLPICQWYAWTILVTHTYMFLWQCSCHPACRYPY